MKVEVYLILIHIYSTEKGWLGVRIWCSILPSLKDIYEAKMFEEMTRLLVWCSERKGCRIFVRLGRGEIE